VILGEGLFGLAVLVLWAYCIFDCITTDESTVQNLPKMIWLLIVIFVPTLGSIAWLLLGRPVGKSFRVGSTGYQTPPPAPPPTGFHEPTIADDDFAKRREETLRRYDAEREATLRQREEELRRREEELRRREKELGES
jgi:hypothetical protein